MSGARGARRKGTFCYLLSAMKLGDQLPVSEPPLIHSVGLRTAFPFCSPFSPRTIDSTFGLTHFKPIAWAQSQWNRGLQYRQLLIQPTRHTEEPD